jgi:GNAT superfamily N-acetyltransferase
MIGSNRFCQFGGWSERSGRPRAPKRVAADAGARPAGGGDATGARWISRPAAAADREVWEELFRGYCDFYERPSSAAGRDRVWEWIGAGTIRCLLAAPAAAPDGAPIGLAHLRPCPSPLRAAMTGYLDDLFVAPSARGTGAYDALVDGIRALATAEGWATVRWITAPDNARAQAAYERVATRTEWVTYQLDV